MFKLAEKGDPKQHFMKCMWIWSYKAFNSFPADGIFRTTYYNHNKFQNLSLAYNLKLLCELMN